MKCPPLNVFFWATCNMSWSVPHPTFWSTKSRIILVCVRNSCFSRILSPTTRDHFRAMFVWFSYPEKTWRRWQLFATIAPCAHVACLFNDLGKFSMLRCNGAFSREKNSNHSARHKTFFSLQACYKLYSFERSLKWPFSTTIVFASE